MLKKEVIIEKASKIFRKKSVIHIYQYNGAGSKNQRFLKGELSQIKKLSALIITNKIMHQLMPVRAASADTKKEAKEAKRSGIENLSGIEQVYFSKKLIEEGRETRDSTKKHLSVIRFDFLQDCALAWYKTKKLFQGPSLLLGCNTLGELSLVLDVLKNYTNFLLLGGQFEKQTITHSTSQKLIRLEPLALFDFIHNLRAKAGSFLNVKA